jgi:hypothetical protein
VTLAAALRAVSYEAYAHACASQCAALCAARDGRAWAERVHRAGARLFAAVGHHALAAAERLAPTPLPPQPTVPPAYPDPPTWRGPAVNAPGSASVN